MLAVPVTYASLKNKDIDVFLGNWMPTMEADLQPYLDDKSVEVIETPNLEGAKYTLAVPTYAFDAGLKSFADIAKFKDALDGKIYGIEPGNDGNRLILGMIDNNKFGLGGFELVESSEQGMLAQVARATSRREPVVFLGWEPHPMNANFQMKYLAGGDDVFGPNFGGATVFTNIRAGYLTECPNVGSPDHEPPLHPADGERDDGRHPQRRQGRSRGRRGVAQGQPQGLAGLAQGRDHLRRPAGPRCGEQEPRALSFRRR